MATLSALAGKAPAEVKDIKLPAAERFVTKDGLQVVAVKRGQLPLIAIRLVSRGGSSTDPKSKRGIADFTARLMRRGTAKMTADQIDEAVEFVGATLSVGVGEDVFGCGATTPAEHLDRILDVMGQVIREPSFPENEVQSAKKRLLAQLSSQLDDAGAVADRAFARAIWGAGHPYAHESHGHRKDIESFTREDLVRFHRERLGPRVSTLYVVGAVDLSKLKLSVERAFAGWTGGPAEPPAVPEMTNLLNAGKVIVIDKPEQTQAQVRIAGPGFARGNPDTFPVTVLNTALGGGFTSRLVNEVRVNRGLSYGVGSHFAGLKAGGYFEISTFTKTASTKEIIQVCLEEVKKARDKGINARELNTAKTYIAGLYPLRFETNEAVAGALADLEVYGLGAEWIETYRSKLAAVTAKDTQTVAKKYLLADKPLIVVVGKASEIVPQLKGFGPVEVLKPSDLE